MTAAAIASILKGRRPDPAGRYRVLGICHQARHNPSLSIWDGDDGGLGAHCFAGCEYPAIIDALERATGLTLARERTIRPPRPVTPKEPDMTPLQAAMLAQRMIQDAELATHPYLAAKGFPEEQRLVLRDELLIPMRGPNGEILSVQRIKADGTKLFLKGGKAGGARHEMGRGRTRWYCEGYATGLSIQAALKHLYRNDRVVVCFSAANIAAIARFEGLVVADNDASGTGERYALKTGLRYWMPPDVGTDANDYHLAHRVKALAGELRRMLV